MTDPTFDPRIAETLRAYGQRGVRRIDPLEVAHRAIADPGRGRFGVWRLPAVALPSPRALLFLAAALFLIIAAALAAAAIQRHTTPLPANGLIAYAVDGRIEGTSADGGDIRTLVDHPVLRFDQPAWSPDGSLLAMTSQDGTQVYVADVVDGTNERVATGSAPAWLPNGDLVFLGSDRQSVWRLADGQDTPTRVANLDAPVQDIGPSTFTSSPDASVVALVSVSPDSMGDGIVFLDVEQGQVQRVIKPSDLGLMAIDQVAWSPDGTQLAVAGSCTGLTSDWCPVIVLVGADGSVGQRYGTRDVEAALPRWSPDGSRLAFVGAADGTSTIQVVSSGGETATVPVPERVVTLQWSPDGTSLLHLDQDDAGAEILRVTDLGGGTTLAQPVTAQSGMAAWQPLPATSRATASSTRGAIGREAPDDQPAAPIPQTDGVETGEAPVGGRLVFGRCSHEIRLTDGVADAGSRPCGDGDFLAWAADGESVVATPATVTVRDAAGQPVHSFAVPSWPDASLVAVMPAWSPDRQWISIDLQTDWGGCGPHRTFVAHPDGSGIREIEGVPQWSPDGTRLLVVQSSVCGQPGKAMIGSADGSDLEPLPIDGIAYVSELHWSPDGARLAYVADGNARVLTIGDSTSVDVSRFELGGVSNVAWSPDGTRLAVTRDTGVYVLPADGAEAPVLVALGLEGYGATMLYPGWSPDGEHIAFVVERSGSGARDATAIARADGGGVVWYRDGGWGAWSPDGTWFAFIRRTPDLVLAAADGSAARVDAVGEQFSWLDLLTWLP